MGQWTSDDRVDLIEANVLGFRRGYKKTFSTNGPCLLVIFVAIMAEVCRKGNDYMLVGQSRY